MVSIRSNNSLPPAQPVRFYKFVALTFLVVTLLLLGIIIFMSSKRSEITIITRAEPVDAHGTVEIGKSIENPSVHGFVTTTVVEMTEIFSPSGEKRQEGIAQGMAILYNDTEFDQPLVATTRLLSTDNILFRLKNAVVVPANGSIEAVVYADKPGSTGDIGPATFSIPGLREDKQKVIYAKSESAMNGGMRTIGVLAQEDIDKAKKILENKILEQGTKQLIVDNPDLEVIAQVAESTYEHTQELGEEVDSFELMGSVTIVGVLYNTEELKTYANEVLETHVVDNSEVLQSVEYEPVVVIESVDIEPQTAQLSITQTGKVNIDPNSKELQKIMFFGKTEDEVRRYVMSLDHVQGVEMHFRPVWNRSVPHVANHVTITVRQVE